jgi:hypothetical protein
MIEFLKFHVRLVSSSFTLPISFSPRDNEITKMLNNSVVPAMLDATHDAILCRVTLSALTGYYFLNKSVPGTRLNPPFPHLLVGCLEHLSNASLHPFYDGVHNLNHFLENSSTMPAHIPSSITE